MVVVVGVVVVATTVRCALAYSFIRVLQTCFLAMTVLKPFALFIPIMFLWARFILKRAKQANKESERISSIVHSPKLSYFGETIKGISTIRAFKKEEQFKEGFYKTLNETILADIMRAGVCQWFSIQSCYLSLTTITLITFLCIIFKGENGIMMSILLG